jgi:serine protease AprX
MDPDKLLPIKVVFPREDVDYQLPDHGGGTFRVFGQVNREVRNKRIDEVERIAVHFGPQFRIWKGAPAVAKVMLKEKAVAKTHRPTRLFREDTCPIIGANRLGELYVSVQSTGLTRLAQEIRHDDTLEGIANISTLKKIEPYTPADVTGSVSTTELHGKSKGKDGRSYLRCRLFRHHSQAADSLIDEAFEHFTSTNQLEDKELMDYAPGLRVFCATFRNQSSASLKAFSAFRVYPLFPFTRLLGRWRERWKMLA